MDKKRVRSIDHRFSQRTSYRIEAACSKICQNKKNDERYPRTRKQSRRKQNKPKAVDSRRNEKKKDRVPMHTLQGSRTKIAKWKGNLGHRTQKNRIRCSRR